MGSDFQEMDRECTYRGSLDRDESKKGYRSASGNCSRLQPTVPLSEPSTDCRCPGYNGILGKLYSRRSCSCRCRASESKPAHRMRRLNVTAGMLCIFTIRSSGLRSRV